MNSTDTRYLSQSHAPLINPLNEALYIELYNDKWFDKPLKTSNPPFTYKYDILKLSDKSVSPFPSVVELHDKTSTLTPQSLCGKLDYNTSQPPSPLTLHTSLANKYSLFFIQYIPEGTIKPRWFLIQVNHIETNILKMGSLRTGDYHVIFLSKHPADKHLCDDKARWWPEWHEYYLDDENIYSYGDRVLFSPKRKSDQPKYIM